MERLDATVRTALQGAGVPDAGSLAEVTHAWPAAVGDAIARAAWPQRITRDGTLLVATTSATWAFELGHLADEILAKITAEMGQNPPTAIRFRPGAVPAPPAPAAGEQPQPAFQADPDTQRLAARLTAAMTDDELRETIARAAAASLARAASGRRF
jgi:hypothetical protein